MPQLHVDLTTDFQELFNATFIAKQNNQDYHITRAMQTLQLDLNNKGAKVKSEAVIDFLIGACMPRFETNKKSFFFGDTFYLFIVEMDNLIVALRINDIKEFIK